MKGKKGGRCRKGTALQSLGNKRGREKKGEWRQEKKKTQNNNMFGKETTTKTTFGKKLPQWKRKELESKFWQKGWKPVSQESNVHVILI